MFIAGRRGHVEKRGRLENGRSDVIDNVAVSLVQLLSLYVHTQSTVIPSLLYLGQRILTFDWWWFDNTRKAVTKE